jgi:molybdopterin molybdotransferase
LTHLLTVDDALARILDRITVLAAERVPTVEALGRILAGDVVAATDIPPFANSSMDGYAVRAADVAGAAFDSAVELSVTGAIPAGTIADRVVEPSEAMRIMTGAPLPPGADAVIPVEQTDDQWASDGGAALPSQVAVYRSVQPGDYVRPAGEDIRAGQTVLRAGSALRPQDMGVLVSLGQTQVEVYRRPRVAIISTGDELVDIDEPLGPGRIRNSNSYVLAGLVSMLDGIPVRLPVARDTLDDVRRCFHDALAHQPDLIVSSAGVSVGTHDVVRTVIEELGALELWRINLRPGKPLAFGQVGGVPFFGLPGNPVSAMVTFDIFVRPALLKQSGGDPLHVPTITAVLGETMRSDGRRTYARVTLTERDDEWIAHPTGTQSSGALLSMVLADGLLIIPEGIDEARAGDRFPVRLLRELTV